jgi:DNA polymerase elongation subunit (family B)
MLEIEVDGLFKPLLLLKKKKYACIKLENLGEMIINP